MLILITGKPASGKSALAKELNWSISCSGRECFVFDEFQNVDLSKPLNLVSGYGEAKDWESFIQSPAFKTVSKIIIIQDAKSLPAFILDRVELHIQCSRSKGLFKSFHRFEYDHKYMVERSNYSKIKYKRYPFAGVVNV